MYLVTVNQKHYPIKDSIVIPVEMMRIIDRIIDKRFTYNHEMQKVSNGQKETRFEIKRKDMQNNNQNIIFVPRQYKNILDKRLKKHMFFD